MGTLTRHVGHERRETQTERSIERAARNLPARLGFRFFDRKLNRADDDDEPTKNKTAVVRAERPSRMSRLGYERAGILMADDDVRMVAGGVDDPLVAGSPLRAGSAGTVQRASPTARAHEDDDMISRA